MSFWRNGGPALLAALLTAAAAGGAQAQDKLLMWSSQATPVEEAQAMRNDVLAGFKGSVDFESQDPASFIARIQAELSAGSGQIDVIGGLHGELASIADNLVDLSDVEKGLNGVEISPAFLKLGQLGTSQQKYLPWMQATYIMAANRKALQYLPKGADLNALTYDQLIAWGQAMAKATGSPKIGLPAGPRGLIHRFVEGSLYPSFTNSMVTRFRSPQAVAMWAKMKELWAVTNPASPSYDFMQEPLLSGDVWVAWDHIARLQDAFNKQPNDFVAFPSPAGPTGRGFMPVVAGLAIPKTAPHAAEAKKLIAYLMQPATQLKTLKATNFFPVVSVDIPKDMPNAVQAEGAAVAAQTHAKDANPGLLPVGLGKFGGQLDKIYTDTFQRILMNGQDPKAVLDEEATQLRRVIGLAKAPCWAPDKPSKGACPVD